VTDVTLLLIVQNDTKNCISIARSKDSDSQIVSDTRISSFSLYIHGFLLFSFPWFHTENAKKMGGQERKVIKERGKRGVFLFELCRVSTDHSFSVTFFCPGLGSRLFYEVGNKISRKRVFATSC
jgi:hypothetical protein